MWGQCDNFATRSNYAECNTPQKSSTAFAGTCAALQGNSLEAFAGFTGAVISLVTGRPGNAARYRRHGLKLRTSQRPARLRQASPCIQASALSRT